MNKQKNNIFYKKILKFLFPFYPIKLISSISGICIISALIGISILLNNFLSIKLSYYNISISFAWLPTYIAGWYFGPVIGFFTGFAIDTINWLISGGIWFWLYAIQEPLVGFIVGIISSSFSLIRNKENSLKWILIVNQVIIFVFIFFSIFIIFYYTSSNNSFFNNIQNNNSSTVDLIKKTNKIYRWIALSFFIGFLIVVESIVFYKIHKYSFKKMEHLEKMLVFFVIVSICIITTTIFSFLLGPISTIEFYKYTHNNADPPFLIKYGIIYYLLPRVVKECFKTPIYFFSLTAIILSLNPIIKSVKTKLINSYN